VSDETLPPPLPGEQRPDAATAGWAGSSNPVLAGRCPVCGAALAYGAGQSALVCGSCGNRLEIQHDAGDAVDEHAYSHWLADPHRYDVESIGGQVLTCQGCGASSETKDLAGSCQFCGGHLVAVTVPAGVIPPEGVLPFVVDNTRARSEFTQWVRSRWFAPSALKKVGDTESIRGTYLPHWTFDAQTTTEYVGERGDHYTEKQGDQEVRKTRWWPAAGTVQNVFDDLLVPASTTLPRNRVDALGPWDLSLVRPYRPEYLVGHSAVRYDTDPDVGMREAQQQMERVIRDDVENDIGGDEQRIHHLDTHYANVMFKLVLLPIWIATFMYAGRQWQVMVNANTGEVVGDRPYSVPKIVAASILALIVLAITVWVFGRNSS
jgi:hypothetical protein